MCSHRLMLLTTALTCIAQVAHGQILPSNDTQLSFSVSSGGNDNYFLRDNVTSAQLLLTSANSTNTLRRLVVALPAGNSGALTYFTPLNSTSGASNLSVSLVNGSFTSTTREYNNTGAQADLSFSGNATLGVTIIGAVRAMRGMFIGSSKGSRTMTYTVTFGRLR